MYKALPSSGEHDKHKVIAWKVEQDLQSKVAQHGLGSAEVMQIIREINTDLLAPFDIRQVKSYFNLYNVNFLRIPGES